MIQPPPTLVHNRSASHAVLLRKLHVSISDVQAVIDSAKSRGTKSLERLIRKRLCEATDAEVRDATELALEIIESVPLFLARAGQ